LAAPQPKMPPSAAELSCKAAIVGVGETDFAADYRAWRARGPGFEAPEVEGLAACAFERALEDSGLARSEIDGLSVSFLYGGPTAPEVAQMLGLKPRYMIDNGGIMAGPLPVACAAVASGECDTIAMVYAVTPRSLARKFGGEPMAGTAAPPSYYYFHPWGWSSQAAHWAYIWRYYQNEFGATEADLGAVAIQLRNNAIMNSNAIMQTPLSIEDYLASRYIVRPLRLLDLCLVNDGGVCLIVRRADRTRHLRHAPVLVAGWGESKVRSKKMHTLVRERLAPQIQEAGDQAFSMAGMGVSHVQHFECYDAATIHLIGQFEGFGFAAPGEGLEFCKAGGMAVGGRMPVNTAGGMLSGAYMHGWNHVAEITKQLRHEATGRQIEGVEISLFSLAQTDQVHPILFKRGVA